MDTSDFSESSFIKNESDINQIDRLDDDLKIISNKDKDKDSNEDQLKCKDNINDLSKFFNLKDDKMSNFKIESNNQ